MLERRQALRVFLDRPVRSVIDVSAIDVGDPTPRREFDKLPGALIYDRIRFEGAVPSFRFSKTSRRAGHYEPATQAHAAAHRM